MRRGRLVAALRGEPTDTTPVWLMRQAGRHLPGYRALRAQHPLLEIARTPELAAEVTLEPVRRYDVDAAVVFADISLPFEGLGVPFGLDPGVGPVVPEPVRGRAEVDRLSRLDARTSLAYVGQAIERYLELESERPIVGFAGGPFTLAAYLIEGRPTKEYTATKRLLFSDPETFDRLIRHLADAMVEYLRLQAESGASALQLFDTWVGALSERRFRRHLLGPLRGMFDALRGTGKPTIYFSTASSHLYPALGGLGADALGVDGRVPLDKVRAIVGDRLALQGNLDPAVLLAPEEVLTAETETVLAEGAGAGGHVFNLGHGVLPETEPERVSVLVDSVHRIGYASRRR